MSTRLSGRFGRLWGASTVGALGDGLTVVAGPLLAVALTRDPIAISGLVVAQRLPWLLFSLPGGALVDRLDPARLMSATALARALALGVVAWAVLAGTPAVALLYAAFFVVGCAGVLFDAAVVAQVPVLVPEPLLARANGRLLAGRTLAGDLLAAPVAAGLFALAAWLPFAADAAALAAVAVVVLTLGGTRPATTDRVPLRTAVLVGLRWLWSHRLLRVLAVTVGLLNLTFAGTTAVLVLIAAERLGGAFAYPALLTALAWGGVVGGLLADRVVRRFGTTAVLRVGLLAEAATHAALAVLRDLVAACVVLALFGLVSMVFATSTSTLRQRLAPPDLLGRVQSAYRLLSTGGAAVGAALAGVLATAVGLTAPLWLGAAAGVGLVLTTWRALAAADQTTPSRT
ncbi:MFS transporter [Saccharothrix obliqua]|uniref:MFS transporter n=1 Tax=Saccharothrix obliqua TaxID=2861747 RepID=UPI001C5E5918|nr:MFS transporter [Saccharothrix obliqua]MBW4720410.1 MFS transporter [Saccharothrix obliqua]